MFTYKYDNSKYNFFIIQNESNQYVFHYKFFMFKGSGIRFSIKQLGKWLGFRSDKMKRILENFGAKRLIYLKYRNFKMIDDSFFFTDKEEAEKCFQWVCDQLTVKQVSENLFI